MPHPCIVCLEPVRAGAFQPNLWYKFAGNRFAHISCMSCSICGSSAHGGKRFVLGTQPFCKTHFQEVRSFRSISSWPIQYLEAAFKHFNDLKDRLEQHSKNNTLTQEMIHISQLSILPTDFSNWGSLNFRTANDAISGINSQIKRIQDILASPVAVHNANDSALNTQRLIFEDALKRYNEKYGDRDKAALAVANETIKKRELAEEHFYENIETIAAVARIQAVAKRSCPSCGAPYAQNQLKCDYCKRPL